jgi:mono/diheme cytochrome c family protein
MVRGSLVLAGLSAVLLLVACEPKARLGNPETEGRWLYELHCAECHENPQPELHKHPPNLHRTVSSQVLAERRPGNRGAGTQDHHRRPPHDASFDRRLSDEEVKDLLQYLRKLK